MAQSLHLQALLTTVTAADRERGNYRAIRLVAGGDLKVAAEGEGAVYRGRVLRDIWVVALGVADSAAGSVKGKKI